MAVMTIVSLAFSAMSAISQGRQQKNAADYNAAVANNNAIAARQQAAANAQAQARESRRRIGTARAGYGASGVALEGSPLDIIEQSAMEAELDRQNILYAGDLKAQGYESTATLERSKGKNAMSSAYFKAGSSLLSSASSYGMNRTS